ncbi:MAG: exopolysaccharide biosynthesis polyprenyl glycosylphosphotransferase [Candidatus Omnitrophica bacterium]|nr:exopolysaccharide biosynthesis polyprenyl glycosylphosphotransferase [Candidatus Omnitrophota bacterium]
MKKMKYIKKIQLTLIILGFAILSISTMALASIPIIEPENAELTLNIQDEEIIPTNLPQEKKTKAPEPATIFLFGSGFIGMVMSFVRKTYAAIKKVLDFIFSVFLFIAISPLMLLLALLVKLTSRGSVIYSQIRVGKDGKLFKIFKFRSMKVDAEKNSGPVWAAENDNRLTPVGGFLRKSHLDELPQLFNVLRGEMSIIGPRPERPKFVDEFKQAIPDYEKRLRVQPGITGLAQVWHRYDETMDDVKKKLKYDLLYIKKMCLWADFNIMLRTVRVVITGEGAR